MKTILITRGSYGMDNGRGGVTVVHRGHTCEVEDGEASRLIDLGVATPAGDAPRSGPGKDPGHGGDAAEGEETAHPDLARLQSMTLAELKKLAEDMDLDASDLRKKADVIDLITAESVYAVDDGETPPDLDAEAPVV